ncbi:hypothetical protein MMC20_005192 [Loxospora ochrophaea]|nr:hypothetical protein [Loxospora ochrophaea]
MSHAHPPDAHTIPETRSYQPSRIPYATAAIVSPARSLAAQRHEDGLNRQRRRLQLRNAGFRGPILPARRISPFLAHHQNYNSPQLPEVHTQPAYNDQHSPKASERRKLYGEDLPPSPVSILQEISNSSRRKRQNPRPSLDTIFQDPSTTENSKENLSTSWYHDASNASSPCPCPVTPNNSMALQQMSLNEKVTPAPHSPTFTQPKSRGKRISKLRSPSFEPQKYIEHLESQMAALSTKLDALTSPTTTRARSAKLRAVTAESRALRRELSEWETKFEERVKNERDERMEAELGLQARIRTLEEEAGNKDIIIKELEWALEHCQAKIADAELVKETNVDLERRIDVLTELLAQSPTKLEFNSALPSPGNPDSRTRIARPGSMFVRASSSPSHPRFSSASAPNTTLWNPREFTSTQSILESPHESFRSRPARGEDESIDTVIRARQSQSLESTSGITTSLQSSSRPTSLISTTSFGASWGLPLSTSSENSVKSTARPRRMRRFPSGSSCLKPLILPTNAVTPSLPASAPLQYTLEHLEQKFPHASFDPTTAFLSSLEHNPPSWTPTQPLRQRSTSWARQQALDALEGRFESLPPMFEHQFLQSPISDNGQIKEEEEESRYGDGEHDADREHSLLNELGRVATKIEPPYNHTIHANATHESSADPNLDGLSSDLQPSSDSPELDALRLESSTENNTRQQDVSVESDDTPKPCHDRVNMADSPANALLAQPVVLGSSIGILHALTGMISRMNQDPRLVARKVVRNAWFSGSSILGGMGWWLIGVLFRYRGRKQNQWADRKTDDVKSSNDFDWHHYSAEASKARRIRRYGESWNPGGDSSKGKSLKLQPAQRAQVSSRGFATMERLTNSPGPFRCEECVEPPSRRTLKLWVQFSLAIVLAIGVAIKDGPGALLADQPAAEANKQGRESQVDHYAARAIDETIHDDSKDNCNNGHHLREN